MNLFTDQKGRLLNAKEGEHRGVKWLIGQVNIWADVPRHLLPDFDINPNGHYCAYFLVDSKQFDVEHHKDIFAHDEQYTYDGKLWLKVNFHGGCTYHEQDGQYVLAGCDYAHYGDGVYEEATVVHDIEKAIDSFLEVLNNES